MADEKRKPKLDLKDLKLGETMSLKLKSAKEIATGQTQYGDWYLWAGEVKDFTVREGEKGSEKIVNNFTGEVVFFPTEKLHEQFMAITGGVNIDIDIELTKLVEEGNNGKLIKKYVARKMSNGGPQKATITPTEMRLINEIQELKADGVDITEDIFITASQEPQYESVISEERAKQLFKAVQNGNN